MKPMRSSSSAAPGSGGIFHQQWMTSTSMARSRARYERMTDLADRERHDPLAGSAGCVPGDEHQQEHRGKRCRLRPVSCHHTVDMELSLTVYSAFMLEGTMV